MNKLKYLLMVFIIIFLSSCTLNQSDSIERIFDDNLETYSISQSLETEITEEITQTESFKKAALEVNFIDVRQADACLLESEGHFMMIDAGNNEDSTLILDYLRSKNVKTIDYMIGTHPHEDHIGGMDTVINNFDIDKVYLPKVMHTSKTFEDVLTAIENKNLKISEPVSGSEFYFNGMTVKILAPISRYDNLNNNSIVLKITDGDVDFLFTGDIETEAEHDIVENNEDLSADVLKVAHHGSDSSSSEEFIKKVSPKYTVISVGKENNYGHPRKSVIDFFDSLNVKTYRTDQNGTIIFKTDGKNIDIVTENESKKISSNTVEKNVNEYFYDSKETKNDNIKKDVDTDNSGEDEKKQTEQTKSELYYIGNKNTKKFHLPSCYNLPSLKNQVKLNTFKEAINKGYSPCKKCEPN